MGTATLPQLTLHGSTTGGVALTNAPQVASSILPSGTVALTLQGTVNSGGTVALTLADSYHRPYLLDTLTYTVDLTPPVDVSLVISAANPGDNIAGGFAQDESPIGDFSLEVNGTLTSCTPAGSGYQCSWNAGNAPENTTPYSSAVPPVLFSTTGLKVVPSPTG